MPIISVTVSSALILIQALRSGRVFQIAGELRRLRPPGAGEIAGNGEGRRQEAAGANEVPSIECEVLGHGSCLPGGAQNGADDPVVRSAPAEIAVERGADVGVGRVGIALEQRVRLDDDAGRAVAALSGLLVDERLLQRGSAGRRSCSPSSVVTSGRPPPCVGVTQERIGSPSMQHGAGSALRAPAAEL